MGSPKQAAELLAPVPLVRVIGPELSADIHQRELGRFTISLRLDRLRNLDRDPVQTVLETLRRIDRGCVESISVTLGAIADAVRPELDAALAGLPVEWLEPAPSPD